MATKPKPIELLPCPFCGAKGEYRMPPKTKKRQEWHYVTCYEFSCTASMANGFHSKEAAIAAWNRRPQ